MDPSLKRRQFFDILAALAATSALGACLSEEEAKRAVAEPVSALEPRIFFGDPPGQHIAMLVYPELTMLDLIGPHTCFSTLGMNVHLVWKTRDPLIAEFGVTVTPTTTFDQCPENLEILFIPGSTNGTANAIRDPDVMRFVRSRGERAKLVTSVCTGSLILGAAGLLRGYKATSHWLTHDLLKLVEAEPVNARIVEDRNRITGAGVTSGIDFGLRIIDRLAGRDLAQLTTLMLEYAPEPPFGTGEPSTAPAEDVAALLAFYSPLLVDGTIVLNEARARF